MSHGKMNRVITKREGGGQICLTRFVRPPIAIMTTNSHVQDNVYRVNTNRTQQQASQDPHGQK